MTYRRFLGFGRAATAVFAVVCWLSGTATGAIIGPYTADANTLHLYHLNESAAPAADTGSATTLRPMSTEVGSPLGAASYSGFGNAASFSGATDRLSDDTATPQSEWQDASTGAFTYEALIRPSTITETNTYGSTIFARDGYLSSSEPSSPRACTFFIRDGNLRFTKIGNPVQVGGSYRVIEGIYAAIPTTGDDAFESDQWYHVAVTYNGQEGTAGNLKLYWTRVREEAETANELVLTSTKTYLDYDVAGTRHDGTAPADVPTSIGNWFNSGAAASQRLNFYGRIDEVRVSDIARGPSDFMFVPEPTSLMLLGIAGFLGLLTRRRR